MGEWSVERSLFRVRFWILLRIAGEEIIWSIISLLFVLLSLCVGMLVWYVGMLVCGVLVGSNKEISLVKSFFQCHTPSIRLCTVKSVCLAFRSPVMIILSAVFLMFSSIVVLMEDAVEYILSIYLLDLEYSLRE